MKGNSRIYKEVEIKTYYRDGQKRYYIKRKNGTDDMFLLLKSAKKAIDTNKDEYKIYAPYCSWYYGK